MVDWFDRPMRWAQITLAENDPPTFDVDFWLDYIRSIHADAVCLSAGGVVAYYPTEVPLHHRSAWLGERDPFGDLLKGCREMGLVVIARTDSHALHQEAASAHPEWVAVGADGSPRRHWSSPELWVACALGPYSFDFMPQIHAEIMQRYRPDGIFTNRWDGSGICYCAACRENFRQASGLDLPPSVRVHDQRWRQYYRWNQERLFQIWELWDKQIRALNPAARFIPNAGGGASSSLDMGRIGSLAPTLFADRQGRHGLMPIWASGKDAKEYRAALGSKPVVGIFSVGLETPYRWKDSVQNEAETRLWVLDGIANGLRPWFTKFAGSLFDRRWLQTVRRLYTWHHANERYLRNRRPLARVGLVYSQQSAAFYGADDPAALVEDPVLGFYQALIEMRLPFEMVHDGLLDAGHLRPFDLLILPNIAALSDEQCAQLRAFVARGGSLVATRETSLCDQNGDPRPDFGLGDLFGVRYLGRQRGPLKNAYLRLEWPPAGELPHPLLAGFEGAERIIYGVYDLETEPLSPLPELPLTLIPAYPDLPMEKVYPRVPRTQIPGVYLRSHGPGKVAYFPWDIDRTFWEVLDADHGRLLANTLDWALNGARDVRVEGPGVLDVTCWQQESSLTVHLINLTNPMLMKGPVRQIYPTGPLTVRVRLPAGLQAGRVQLLVAGQDLPVLPSACEITLTLPSLADHEVIAIDTLPTNE